MWTRLKKFDLPLEAPSYFGLAVWVATLILGLQAAYGAETGESVLVNVDLEDRKGNIEPALELIGIASDLGIEKIGARPPTPADPNAAVEAELMYSVDQAKRDGGVPIKRFEHPSKKNEMVDVASLEVAQDFDPEHGGRILIHYLFDGQDGVTKTQEWALKKIVDETEALGSWVMTFNDRPFHRAVASVHNKRVFVGMRRVVGIREISPEVIEIPSAVEADDGLPVSLSRLMPSAFQIGLGD